MIASSPSGCSARIARIRLFAETRSRPAAPPATAAAATSSEFPAVRSSAASERSKSGSGLFSESIAGGDSGSAALSAAAEINRGVRGTTFAEGREFVAGHIWSTLRPEWLFPALLTRGSLPPAAEGPTAAV